MTQAAGGPAAVSPADALLGRLGAELRRRRIQAGVTSQAMLAKKITYARAYIAQVELAREAPSAQFVHACDQALHTGGALMELYRRFDNARREARSALASPPPSPDDLWNPTTQPPPASALEPLIREQHNRRVFLRDATIMAGTATAAGRAWPIEARNPGSA